MAIQHNCDVCGEYVEKYFTYINTIRIPTMLVPIEQKGGKTQVVNTSTRDIDLCNSCMIELRVFLGLDPTDRVKE